MKLISTLSVGTLLELSSAIAASRIVPPFTGFAFQRYLPPPEAAIVAVELEALTTNGVALSAVPIILNALAQRDTLRLRDSSYPDLVLSGPEAPGGESRSTAVVVEELFSTAKHSVLVAGYAVHKGEKVFETLARRMAEVPNLDVRLYLHVHREWNDPTPREGLVDKFRSEFVLKNWPTNSAPPPIFFYPRSLDVPSKGSLHAKCVVVDERRIFITSANFTPAAQERNIEMGLLMTSPALAVQIEEHFARLVAASEVVRL